MSDGVMQRVAANTAQANDLDLDLFYEMRHDRFESPEQRVARRAAPSRSRPPATAAGPGIPEMPIDRLYLQPADIFGIGVVRLHQSEKNKLRHTVDHRHGSGVRPDVQRLLHQGRGVVEQDLQQMGSGEKACVALLRQPLDH